MSDIGCAAIGCAANTDREIWREREGDCYADSIHVTKDGGIGINCGGFVFVKPLRIWFELAGGKKAFGGPPRQTPNGEAPNYRPGDPMPDFL